MARKPFHGSSDTEQSYFDNYDQYARTVRAWFVAYGIGAPVLLLTNDHISSCLATSPITESIALMFLWGVGLQVALALVNKWASWYLYAGFEDKKLRKGLAYRIMSTISEQTWIDVLVDLLTSALFFYGTWSMFTLVSGASCAS